MRQLFLGLMLVGLAACNSGSATAAESTLISATVRDDIGTPVVRTRVRVTLPDATYLDQLTRSDGTVDIAIAEPGTYKVSVIPRYGYLAGVGSEPKTVTIEMNATIMVDFTIYRGGLPTADPFGQK